MSGQIKGSTWELEEIERLKYEIDKLKEERDAWKRSSELYEQESNHWYLRILEQDSRLEMLVKMWKDPNTHDEGCEPNFHAHDCICGGWYACAEELENILYGVKDNEK